jgi:hypothetical protein
MSTLLSSCLSSCLPICRLCRLYRLCRSFSYRWLSSVVAIGVCSSQFPATCSQSLTITRCNLQFGSNSDLCGARWVAHDTQTEFPNSPTPNSQLRRQAMTAIEVTILNSQFDNRRFDGRNIGHNINSEYCSNNTLLRTASEDAR